MKPIKASLFFLLTVIFFSSYAQKDSLFSAGYTDSLGNYTWYTYARTRVIMMDSVKWYYVTSEKQNWDEANQIRNANILAFTALGIDSSEISRDLFLYDEHSSLFTKHTYLRNSSKYIKGWKTAFNSEDFTHTAQKSMMIIINDKKSRMVLKFYPNKGGIKSTQAIGLVKKGFVPHSFEALMEITEYLLKKVFRNKDPNDDPLYDAHYRNARKLIKKHSKQ